MGDLGRFKGVCLGWVRCFLCGYDQCWVANFVLAAIYCLLERPLSRKKVFTLQAVRMMFGRDRITKDEQPERFSPSGGMHKCAACGQTNVVSNIQKSTTS